MFYKISSHDESRGSIFIPPGFLQGISPGEKDSFKISAGRRTRDIKIAELKGLKENELMLSHDVLEYLSIPANLKYQAVLDNNCIRLGPCIGLLMANDPEELTGARLRRLLPYTFIYHEIQGLLIAFSVEGIDFENKLVEGYCYSPGHGNGRRLWQEGRFPLPDSIFMRLNPPEPVRVKLIKSTGNRMFNSNYFDKWEFWERVSKYPKAVQHLPATRLYSSMDDLDYILTGSNSAYLKPLNGTLSRGLYKIKKTVEGYIFQDRLGRRIMRTPSRAEADSFINRITAHHRYLVQQAIESISVDSRHVDFRVIMQKDHTMKWICTGMVGFIGRPDDICTNWGSQTTFEDLLADNFNYSQEMIFKKKQEVIEVCTDICKILDSTGDNYGDLGFDVIIDKSMEVFVLEGNKRHYHSVPLWINDKETFYKVKSNPVKYAAALAGFKVY